MKSSLVFGSSANLVGTFVCPSQVRIFDGNYSVWSRNAPAFRFTPSILQICSIAVLQICFSAIVHSCCFAFLAF
jgi:hypothetical protein